MDSHIAIDGFVSHYIRLAGILIGIASGIVTIH